jgi:hypothetical protein
MSKPGRINVEATLDDLYGSEINVEISWLCGIDVKLGDALNGYEVEGKVGTFAEAAVWLRDQACAHYPDSDIARSYNVSQTDAQLRNNGNATCFTPFSSSRC